MSFNLRENEINFSCGCQQQFVKWKNTNITIFENSFFLYFKYFNSNPLMAF